MPSSLLPSPAQEPAEARHCLYMFHPTLPSVLLALVNISDNIIAFRGESSGLGPGLCRTGVGLGPRDFMTLSPQQRSCWSPVVTQPVWS